jgi:hypothetical protein
MIRLSAFGGSATTGLARVLLAMICCAGAIHCTPASPPPCDFSTCPAGCCDSSGKCVGGRAKEACGTAGILCSACPTRCGADQVCAACDFFAQDCDANLYCYPQRGSTTCGTPGAVLLGMACTAGTCERGSDCFTFNNGGSACAAHCNLDGGVPACGAGTCQSVGALLIDGVGVCQ